MPASVFNSIANLQWAHETLMRLIALVQFNSLIGAKQQECVVQLAKSVVLLEGLIQESLAEARRRRDESQRT